MNSSVEDDVELLLSEEMEPVEPQSHKSPSSAEEDLKFKEDDSRDEEIEPERSIFDKSLFFEYMDSSFSSYKTIESSIVTSNSISDSIEEKLGHETIDNVTGGQVGLRNLGNTCFLNSTLQCLLAADELSLSLAEDLINDRIEHDKKFSYELAKLFVKMWSKPSSGSSSLSFVSNTVDPRTFKFALGQVDQRFEGYRQEDSQEALAIILDRLHEELKISATDLIEQENDKNGWIRYCNKENSIVRRLFHGQLRSTLTCCQCGHASETFDPFCFLNLPFPQEKAPEPSKGTFEIPEPVKDEPLSKRFRVAVYNTSITGLKSCNLKIYKTFEDMQDFRGFFAGKFVYIATLRDDGTVEDYKLSLRNVDRTLFSKKVMLYRLDAIMTNYIVSLHLPHRKGIGFPVVISLPLKEKFSVSVFVQHFFNETVSKVVKLKYPDNWDMYKQLVALMLEDPEAHFVLKRIDSVNIALSAVDIEILETEATSILFNNDLGEFFAQFSEKEPDDDDDLEHDDEEASLYAGYNRRHDNLSQNSRSSFDFDRERGYSRFEKYQSYQNDHYQLDRSRRFDSPYQLDRSYQRNYERDSPYQLDRGYQRNYERDSPYQLDRGYQRNYERDSPYQIDRGYQRSYGHDTPSFPINRGDRDYSSYQNDRYQSQLGYPFNRERSPYPEEDDFLSNRSKRDYSPYSNLPSHSPYRSLHSRSHLSSSYQPPKPLYPAQVNLSDCFNTFLVEEQVTATCEKCQATGTASKKLDLWRLPPILILHLKRFSAASSSSSIYSYSFGGLGGFGSKINSRVEFPVTEPLVLKPLSGDAQVEYDLIAVSQHFGSLYGGHYTAVTWHRQQNCWSLADDGSITRYASPADWVDGAKSAAYVLFYRLRQ